MNVFEERIREALEVATRYAGVDGAHHKQWVIAQMVRCLTSHRYDEWVRAYREGEDGPQTYCWDEGTPP